MLQTNGTAQNHIQEHQGQPTDGTNTRPQGQPKSAAFIDQHGLTDSADLSRFLALTLGDVSNGRLSPNVGGALGKLSSQLLRVKQLELTGHHRNAKNGSGRFLIEEKAPVDPDQERRQLVEDKQREAEQLRQALKEREQELAALQM